MNKKKIMGLALSGALLVGAASLGTYAYFTDVAQVDANLVIQTGTLKTEAQNNDVWKVVDGTGVNESEITNKNATNNFKNVRPGDWFEKTVTIKNVGTLKQKLIVEQSDIPGTIEKYFNVDIKDLAAELEGKVLEPEGQDGDSITVDIKAQLKPELANEYTDSEGEEHKNQDYTFDMTELSKQVNDAGGDLEETPLIKIETTQVNNPKTSLDLFNK